MKAIIEAKPMQIILKPGKLKGALSDRNKAVKGEKTNGEITFAKEQIPEIHP
jgi:hypothetical protein